MASQAGSQASQASQAGRPVTSPSPKEGGSLAASPVSQAGAHLPPAGENSSQAGNNLPSSQAGSQITRSGRQNPSSQPGKGPSRLPRGAALPPGRQCWYLGWQSHI